MLRQPARLASLIFSSLLLLATASLALAQGNKPLDFEPDFLKNLPDLGGAPLGGQDVVFSAFLIPPRDGAPPLVAVQAEVAKGFHIYSVTQPPKGPLRTEITLDKSPSFTLAGAFQADTKPEVSTNEFWPNVPIEEHRGVVTWVAPLQLAPDADLQTLTITGRISGQLCTDDLGTCRPFDLLGQDSDRFTAKLATAEQLASVKPLPEIRIVAQPAGADAEAPAGIGQFAARDNNPIIRGHIEPKIVTPGGMAKLVLSIEPQAGWHVYLRANEAPKTPGSRPTLIALTNISGLAAREPATETKVVVKGEQQYYDGPATWTVQIPIPPSAQPGDLKIEGLLGYQVCSDSTCNAPSGVAFRGLVAVGAQNEPGEMPLGFDESSYQAASDAMNVAATTTTPPPSASSDAEVAAAGAPTDYSFGQILVMAFLGGLILNVMPCVLPVIGLKIFSFVEQSGQNRMKNLMLNVWYAAGVTSIFLVLALLAIFFRLGWGQLFQYPEFKVAMAAVIFAMGLSFIGVWEIPIPGFVGSPGVSTLESKEGYTGAFVKGGVTTLLATPCTGPLMGTALIGVLNRPPEQILGIFLAMGLGMSSPYVTIGVFPELVKFLPRPGNWMNTFKQLMGFILLGTVLFLLTSLQSFYVVPTIVLLFGLSVACWLVGDLPLMASDARKWTVRAVAVGLVAASAVLAFTWLAPVMYERNETSIAKRIELDRESRALDGGTYVVENKPWQPYTEKKLQWLLDNGKTVVIDFTADWCGNCIFNEQTVLKTQQTQERFLADDVYTLVADWTHRDEAKEVTAKLEELGAKQIPLVAIYSPAEPERPTLIPGILQAQDVYAKVDAASAKARESAAIAAPLSTSRTAMMPKP